MKSPVIKRSIVIAGHKTSVSLEDAFWKGLKDIAGTRDMTLSELVAAIDSDRRHGNLSSAIRLFVLDHYRSQHSEERSGRSATRELIASRPSRHRCYGPSRFSSQERDAGRCGCGCACFGEACGRTAAGGRMSVGGGAAFAAGGAAAAFGCWLLARHLVRAAPFGAAQRLRRCPGGPGLHDRIAARRCACPSPRWRAARASS